jgi:hypothetical protein
MVRRWSYINYINTLDSLPCAYKHARRSTFDTNVRATMRWRRNSRVRTVFVTRKRWARRRHIYGWLTLSNVLKSWAFSYRFHKNHSKIILNQHLTNNSFIAFNLVSAKNAIPSLYKGSELVAASTYTKRILKYFSYFDNPRTKFLLNLGCANVASVSYIPKFWTPANSAQNDYVAPLLLDTFEGHTNCFSDVESSSVLSLQAVNLTLDFALDILLRTLKTLYRVLVLLTLMRVHGWGKN